MLPRPKPATHKKRPRRSEWIRNRAATIPDLGAKCPVSGEPLWQLVPGETFYKFLGVVDHLVCERLVRSLKLGRPHALINLLAVSKSAHSKKTAIEKHLEASDLLRFRQEIKALGWPMERVDAALRHYGLMR